MDLLQYFIKACNCDVEQNKKKTKCLHDIEGFHGASSARHQSGSRHVGGTRQGK